MTETGPVRVTLVALPDAVGSVLSGFNDVLGGFALLSTFYDTVPTREPFAVEIVGLERGQALTASGRSIETDRSFAEVESTDVVILPPVILSGGEWHRDRHPAFVDWLKRMHRGGAQLASACSGVLVLAETGLLDGGEATLHWIYGPTFRRNFPGIRLLPEKPLVRAGARNEFLMCGGSSTWQLLALHLIALHVGTAAAQAVAKFYTIQWHRDGLAPFISFHPRRDHGDAAIETVQAWLDTAFTVARPVEEMVRRSGLAERTFKRRFGAATGYKPIEYVQLARIAEAKKRLEDSDDAIDEISWQVGYEDAAFFRRLFKRVTNLTPGAYRRQFRLPEDLASEARVA